MFVKHANQNFSMVMKKINLHYTNLLQIFSLNPETLKPLETEVFSPAKVCARPFTIRFNNYMKLKLDYSIFFLRIRFFRIGWNFK